MPRRFFAFREMLTDSQEYDSPALQEVINALPLYGSYRSIRQLRSASSRLVAPLYNPWLVFSDQAGSEVNFTINPWGSTADVRDDFAIAARVRFNSVSAQVIARAGINATQSPGEGWVLNISGEGQASIRAGGDSAGATETVVAVTTKDLIQRGDRWYVIGAQYDSDAELLEIFLDEEPSREFSARTFSSSTSSLSWDALDMEWAESSGGGQRLDGDIERVVVWDSLPTRQEMLDFMKSPLSSVSSPDPKFVWLLRENTGTTVSNSGTGGTADGTLGTAVSWAGDSFQGYSAMGVTGGFSHFFTATSSSQEAGPGSDETIDDGWKQFGAVDEENPDDFFRQLNEKNPDDSRGILFTASGTGIGTYETGFEDAEDPESDLDHVVAYRYRFAGVEKADEWKLTTELHQDGTKIADLEAHSNTSDTLEDEDWREVRHTLETTEAASISDYGELRLRAIAELSGAELQTAIPDADIANKSGWVNEDGDDTGLFASIDGPTVDTDTFAESNGINPGGTSTYRFSLSEVESPLTDEGFVFRTTASSQDEGLKMRVRVLDDGNQVVSKNFGEITPDPEEHELIISANNAAKFSNFGSLAAEVTFSATASSAGSSLIEFSPSAFDGPKVNTVGQIGDLTSEDSKTVDTGAGGDGGRFRVWLEAGQDPGTNENHRIRMIAHRTGGNAGVSVQLLSGGTTVFDSRDEDGPGGQSLPTSSGSEIVFSVPVTAVDKINSYQSLKIQVLTHAGASGGTGHYDFLALEIPSGRKGRVYGAFLELPSTAQVGLSWARIILPSPSNKDEPDTTELYSGDARRLYLVQEGQFEDVSKAGAYASNAEVPRSWDFTAFGENIIATNKVDPVQVKKPADTVFGDLITSVDKPKFATVCVVQRHLIGANVSFVGSPNGQADEWWVSAFDDPADFQVSLSTGANRGRIKSAPGEIVKAVGGEYALLFKENSIHRLDWVGPPGTFRPEVVSMTDGTRFPRSVVQVGRDAYFLDADGFKVVRVGQRVDPIGAGAVNRTVSDSEFSPRAVKPVDAENAPEADSSAIGAYDPVTGLVWWALRATGGGGQPSNPLWRNGTFLVYNPVENRWTFLELEGLSATHLFGLPLSREASSSIARGIGVASLEGDFPTEYNLRFGRFLGESSYPARFVTKIWSSKFLTNGEIYELYIRNMRPSFRMAPAAVARPNVSITSDASDDPLLQFDVRTETVSVDQASPDQWHPFHSSGEFFRFTVTFPELFDQTIREVGGIEIDYTGAGER